MVRWFQYNQLLLLVLVLQIVATQSQISNDAEDNTVVSDGTSEGRDNESVAQTAVLITGILCAAGTLMCLGAVFYLIYQKCCVEECII